MRKLFSDLAHSVSSQASKDFLFARLAPPQLTHKAVYMERVCIKWQENNPQARHLCALTKDVIFLSKIHFNERLAHNTDRKQHRSRVIPFCDIIAISDADLRESALAGKLGLAAIVISLPTGDMRLVSFKNDNVLRYHLRCLWKCAALVRSVGERVPPVIGCSSYYDYVEDLRRAIVRSSDVMSRRQLLDVLLGAAVVPGIKTHFYQSDLLCVILEELRRYRNNVSVIEYTDPVRLRQYRGAEIDYIILLLQIIHSMLSDGHTLSTRPLVLQHSRPHSCAELVADVLSDYQDSEHLLLSPVRAPDVPKLRTIAIVEARQAHIAELAFSILALLDDTAQQASAQGQGQYVNCVSDALVRLPSFRTSVFPRMINVMLGACGQHNLPLLLAGAQSFAVMVRDPSVCSFIDRSHSETVRGFLLSPTLLNQFAAQPALANVVRSFFVDIAVRLEPFALARGAEVLGDAELNAAVDRPDMVAVDVRTRVRVAMRLTDVARPQEDWRIPEASTTMLRNDVFCDDSAHTRRYPRGSGFT